MSLAVLAEARHQAEGLGNLVLGLELIAASYPQAGAEARFHLRALARWILCRSEAARRRAAELALPAELMAGFGGPLEAGPAEPALGLARTLLVDADRSGEAFLATFLAEQSASTEPSPDGLAELCGRAERCLFRLLGRRGWLPALSAYRLRFIEPPLLRRYSVSGRSAEAAAALALFSLWSRLPVPPGLLVSAALGDGGELLPAAELTAKARAALREDPGLSLLAVAASAELPFADPRLRPVGTLEELLGLAFGEAALAAAPAFDLEGALRFGLELYEKRGCWKSALEVLRAVKLRCGTAGNHRVEAFLAGWRSGSCLLHLGDPRGALAELEEARRLGELLWADGEINPQAYFNARGSLAVALRDLRRFEEAEALLLSTLAEQRGLRQDKREVAKTLGNLGELWTLMGRFEEAEAALVEALAALRAVYPEEVPRELCYLGNLALRRGELEHALTLYKEGLEENRHVLRGQAANAAFLRYGQVRALLAAGRAGEALEVAALALQGLPAEQIFPRCLLLKQRGLAELALGLPAGEDTLLAAADSSPASGALARFAAASALGELAIHRLKGPEPASAWAPAARFVAQSAELLDGLWATGLAGRLEKLLERSAPGDPAAALALARELRQALELLPV